MQVLGDLHLLATLAGALKPIPGVSYLAPSELVAAFAEVSRTELPRRETRTASVPPQHAHRRARRS